MVTRQEIEQLIDGGTVVDQEGGKIGKVDQVFLDDQTSEPEWATVKTGLFGGAASFVPLRDARVSGDSVTVPFSKDKVKDAPRVEDSDGHLSREEEAELYRYYDRDYAEDAGNSGAGGDGAQGAGHDVGRGEDHRDRDAQGRREISDDDAGTMTRSEEQVAVGTEQVSAGKVRLRKYVVTENVTKTVPVSREEVRVEREPITDANRDSVTNATIGEDDQEVELMQERVVVDKETVPVEKVSMGKENVTEEQQVSEEVRKEQIEAEESGRTETHPER